MRLKFVNREAELLELDKAATRGGLVVVYGRRRVGKTRLLRRWLYRRENLYSQAIEAQRDHAASVFEDFCRARYPGARRFWEGDVELDLVAPDPDDSRRLVVAEIKFRRLSVAARKNELRKLETKWAKCTLRARHAKVRFEVLDTGILGA